MYSLRQLSKRPWIRLLGFFLIWRVALTVVGLVAPLVFPERPDFAYAITSHYTPHFLGAQQPWFSDWANFDGIHYLNIAHRGYETEGRFFPLLPLLIQTVSFPLKVLGLTHPELIAGMVLVHVAAFGTVWLLFQLVRLDFSEEVAFKACLALLVFPTSFFLVSVYSESLYLFLTLGSFWLARKQRWFGTIPGIVSLALTRLVGILLLPSLWVEWWTQRSSATGRRGLITVLASTLTSGLSLLGWMWFNTNRWQDPLYFLHAHGELGNSRSTQLFVFPLQTLWRYGNILFTLPPTLYEWWVASWEVVTALGVGVVLVAAVRQKLHISYLIFGWLSFMVPVLSGTFTGLPRYALVLFPLFIVLGQLRSWGWYVYIFLGLVHLLMFAALFTQGYFIA